MTHTQSRANLCHTYGTIELANCPCDQIKISNPLPQVPYSSIMCVDIVSCSCFMSCTGSECPFFSSSSTDHDLAKQLQCSACCSVNRPSYPHIQCLSYSWQRSRSHDLSHSVMMLLCLIRMQVEIHLEEGMSDDVMMTSSYFLW